MIDGGIPLWKRFVKVSVNLQKDLEKWGEF